MDQIRQTNRGGFGGKGFLTMYQAQGNETDGQLEKNKQENKFMQVNEQFGIFFSYFEVWVVCGEEQCCVVYNKCSLQVIGNYYEVIQDMVYFELDLVTWIFSLLLFTTLVVEL